MTCSLENRGAEINKQMLGQLDSNSPTKWLRVILMFLLVTQINVGSCLGKEETMADPFRTHCNHLDFDQDETFPFP